MRSDTMLAVDLGDGPDIAGLNYQGSVIADLLDCRTQCEQLEKTRERDLHAHHDRLYDLAALVYRLATALTDQAAWSEFLASADWGDRKRPRQRDRAKAFRHAVRYVLPSDASRQTLSHWTIPLEVLRDEGIPGTEIAEALSARGGFQQICTARARAKRQVSTNNDCKPAKLFKRPPSALPNILRDAIVVTDTNGQRRLEDGQQRVVLFLAVPKRLMSEIRPGELHISAVVGTDDLSVLDAIGIDVEVPLSLIHRRVQPEAAAVVTDDPVRQSTH